MQVSHKKPGLCTCVCLSLRHDEKNVKMYRSETFVGVSENVLYFFLSQDEL